jgi:hypothetical protein
VIGSFADKSGTQWSPEINVVTIKRVRELLDINLLELVMPESKLPERLNDPCLLVDVLYALCKDEADGRSINDVDFGASMTPDGIEDAWSIVLQGIVNFSPRGLRPAYQRVLETAKKYRQTQTQKVTELLESPEFETMLTNEMERRLSTPESVPISISGDATNSPASSESTPDATPSQP